MNDELAICKAVMQADRGDPGAAEATLRQLLSTRNGDSVERVRALVILGDMLTARGDAESVRPLLNEALSTAERLDNSDDLLDYELMRARELLR